MVLSILKAWLTRMATRRRLLDELADLSSEQLRDAGLDLRDVVLPRRIEPDDVMMQRVDWRADHEEVEAQICKNGRRMSWPASERANALPPTLRFSAATTWVAL